MSICHDRWLPREHSFKIIMVKPLDTSLDKVGDLIDKDIGAWDEQRIL